MVDGGLWPGVPWTNVLDAVRLQEVPDHLVESVFFLSRQKNDKHSTPHVCCTLSEANLRQKNVSSRKAIFTI